MRQRIIRLHVRVCRILTANDRNAILILVVKIVATWSISKEGIVIVTL